MFTHAKVIPVQCSLCLPILWPAHLDPTDGLTRRHLSFPKNCGEVWTLGVGLSSAEFNRLSFFFLLFFLLLHSYSETLCTSEAWTHTSLNIAQIKHNTVKTYISSVSGIFILPVTNYMSNKCVSFHSLQFSWIHLSYFTIMVINSVHEDLFFFITLEHDPDI